MLWGRPSLRISKNARNKDMGDLENLAIFLRDSGDEKRLREILGMSLKAMDNVATTFKRGEFWFMYSRVRVLSLLGRTEQALDAMEAWWALPARPAPKAPQ
jgi:hypothetical protein